MQKFKNILCHPSRVGLYHKDSFLVVLIYLVLYLGVLIGILAVKTYNTTYFDYSDVSYITNMIEYDKSENNVEYKDYKLTGKEIIIKSSNFECYILGNTDINKIQNNGMIFFMKEDSISVYYAYSHLKTISYTDIKANYSFNTANIKNHDSKELYQLTGFFDYVLTDINTKYATHTFITNIVRILEYYFIFAVAIMAVFSFFINPDIRFDVRAKLVIYDSLIYFLIMGITILYNFSYLQYFAIICPLIYCATTFSHIMRVRK